MHFPVDEKETRQTPLLSSDNCSTYTKVNQSFLFFVVVFSSLASTHYGFYWLDEDTDEITIEGTITFCKDLKVDPEEVVLLAIAYELKSPRIGQWTRQGWIDGWKNVGQVSGTPNFFFRSAYRAAVEPIRYLPCNPRSSYFGINSQPTQITSKKYTTILLILLVVKDKEV